MASTNAWATSRDVIINLVEVKKENWSFRQWRGAIRYLVCFIGAALAARSPGSFPPAKSVVFAGLRRCGALGALAAPIN